MSFEPASGNVFISTGGTPKPLFQETVDKLKHQVPPEAVAAYLKPVMKLHYAAGRLTFAQPVSIDGVSPDNYFISGVTAKSGVLYVLEINTNRIYRLSGPNYAKQSSAETGARPYAALLERHVELQGRLEWLTSVLEHREPAPEGVRSRRLTRASIATEHADEFDDDWIHDMLVSITVLATRLDYDSRELAFSLFSAGWWTERTQALLES